MSNPDQEKKAGGTAWSNNMTLRFLIAAILLIVTVPALAKEPAPVTPLTKLDAATEKMLKGLDKNQIAQFAAIRDSHGILQSVKDVEMHIGNAVKSCSDKNPSLANSIQQRYADWKKGLAPIIRDAKKRQTDMIEMQTYATPNNARQYLKLVDEAVAYKGRGIDYIPIDSEKECRKLIDKMDDTEANLQKLMVRHLRLDKDILIEKK